MLTSEKMQSFGEKLRGRMENIVVDQEKKKRVIPFHLWFEKWKFFGFLYKDFIFYKKRRAIFCKFYLRPDI